MKLALLKNLIISLGGGLIKALFTKKMFVWSLRLYAKCTKNKIDDGVADLIDALLHNRIDDAQVALKSIGEKWLKNKESKNKELTE